MIVAGSIKGTYKKGDIQDVLKLLLLVGRGVNHLIF